MSTGGRGQAGAGQWVWMLAALAVVVSVALGLRLGTRVSQKSELFDEPYSIPPIRNIVHDGWSVRTAIDFEETKGPALIWPYALWGQVLGDELTALRWLSIVCFCAGVLPLVAIARMARVQRLGMVVVAGLYALLPHLGVVGQLVMSEASFVTGSLFLLWTYLKWANADSESALTRSQTATTLSRGERERNQWPVIYGVLLAVLLHNRVHAVAFAGAICLTAFTRSGWRSWPWWLASVCAGLSRIPLWVRWGGLVSPENQDRIGIGLRLESLTYLGAGLVPFTAVLLWPVLFTASGRGRRWLVAVGAAVGLVLGFVSMPPLGWTYEVVYNGFVATFATKVAEKMHLAGGAALQAQQVIVTLMAMAALGSVGALAALAWPRRDEASTQAVAETQSDGDRMRTVLQLQFWSIVIGWSLYGLTYGYVFDRYIMPWCVLLPIVWWKCVRPRWLLVLQAIGLVVILWSLTYTWLMWGRGVE